MFLESAEDASWRTPEAWVRRFYLVGDPSYAQCAEYPTDRPTFSGAEGAECAEYPTSGGPECAECGTDRPTLGPECVTRVAD